MLGLQEKIMEIVKELSFWAFMAQLVLLAILLAGVITLESRIEREIAKKRPLLDSEQWAAMQPGDTALIMLKMDQMTEDQQQRMMKGIIQIMQRARGRGIEVIALPVRKGDQAVVVTRSIEQGNNGGQSDDGPDALAKKPT